jgi:hypothetical protein
VARSRRLRDCVIWAVILGGHALLIVVFTSGKRHVAPVIAEAPSPGVLVVLSLPPPTSDAASESAVLAPTLASVPVITPRLPPPPNIESESTAITPPEQEPEGPGSNAIDWQLEAERSAKTSAENSTKRGPKRIGEHPLSPFRQPPKAPEFGWAPPKAGVGDGLIAYVHVTQRCIVGVGLAGPVWGCALGKLPEANGRLFDGMADPNRQRSSVPAIDASSALDPPPD